MGRIRSQLKRALRRYCRADFLVIDDFAVLAMDPAQANLAFQVISERYEYHRSTCITTNRLFKDWPKVFPTHSMPRSSPSASPSVPSVSSSTERGIDRIRTQPD
jgi:DNA replication protein DnaC